MCGYRYLKHPIFIKHQLMALASPDLVGINCGLVYAHNAHPAGPTSWAAFQVPDRTLRWLDDADYILPILNSTNNRFKLQDIGFEQSVFNDAVWSIVSGQGFFAHSLRPAKGYGKAEWEAYHRSIGPELLKAETVGISSRE
jgi:hypothetical protein